MDESSTPTADLVREQLSLFRGASIAAAPVRTLLIPDRTQYPAARPQPGKTVAEFFAGIGLMRMGLEQAGWHTVYANDIDPAKYVMYQGHFADPKPVFEIGDVHKLPASAVPTVTLATASFPCNDLSLAGAREGLKGKESSAYWGFVRVLRDMGGRRPAIVLLENVMGFLTSHQGKDFRDALSALADMGYSVDAFMLDAAWFVPQSRRRLFVVGVQRGSVGGDYWAACRAPADIAATPTRPPDLVAAMRATDNLPWAVRQLPDIVARPGALADIVEDLPEGAPEWWSEARCEYLLAQMSHRHREMVEVLRAGTDLRYATVFRRVRNNKSMAEVRYDGVAGCLRTPRGGSGRQILVRAGRGTVRARLLTPTECARLMGAPDYRITVARNQALFGFGDAVCVPAIRWIGENYLNSVVVALGSTERQTGGEHR